MNNAVNLQSVHIRKTKKIYLPREKVPISRSGAYHHKKHCLWVWLVLVNNEKLQSFKSDYL